MKNKNELIEFVKDRLINSDDYKRDIWNYLVKEGYPEELVNDVVWEGFDTCGADLPKIKINPYNIDEHHGINFDNTVKLKKIGGYVGLAELVYPRRNPFSKKKTIKGFSLHNDEGEMRRFVYLSYYEQIKKSLMPSKSDIKYNDIDEYFSYKRAGIEEILEKTKRMHDNPKGGDFEDVIEYEMKESQDTLKDMMKSILKNYQYRPFIIKNSRDNSLTFPLETDGKYVIKIE